MSKPFEDLFFRPATEGDFMGLLQLYRHLMPNDLPASPQLQFDTFQQMLDHPGITVLVGSSEKLLVTTLTLVVIPNLTRGCAPYALIENVVTHADFRGRGLGEKIVAEASQVAWDAGCYKIMLMSGVQNTKAHAFYERAGFKRSKTGFEIRKPGFPTRNPA